MNGDRFKYPKKKRRRQAWSRHYLNEKKLIAKGIIDVSDLTFPDFYCIGAQKAGTTWLYSNLKVHPEISLASKEYHFYDKYLDIPIQHYASSFDVGANKLAGDITPSYAVINDLALSLMKRLSPRAKILFIARNPVDRAWSGLLMHFFKRRNLSPDALTQEAMIRFLDKPMVMERSNYQKTVARYTETFGSEQVCVLDFDEISLNPKGFMSKVLTFLGLSSEPFASDEKLQKVVHQRAVDLEIPAEVKAHLQRALEPNMRAFAEMYPEIGNKWFS